MPLYLGFIPLYNGSEYETKPYNTEKGYLAARKYYDKYYDTKRCRFFKFDGTCYNPIP
jgi:hypothetical protein